MYNREKVIEQLNQVQQKCEPRFLTIEEIEFYIDRTEKWLKDHNVPDALMKYIQYEYHDRVFQPTFIAKLFLTFSPDGKVNDVKIQRGYSQVLGKTYVSRFRLNKNALKELRIDWFDSEEKNTRIKNQFISNYGFNPVSLMAQL